MSKKTLILRQIYLFLTVGLCIFLDQWTKLLAVDNLKGKPAVSVLGDFLVWQYAENEGAAFSMFEGKQWPLTVVSIIIALTVLFFYEVSTEGKHYIPIRIAYLLIIGGAIGNMIDRIQLNYVRDFIYVKIINFPIFNVADIFVTCSCGLLIILFIFVYKENDKLTILSDKKSSKADGAD